jgi:Acetyltransferase (GNAT) domain
MLEATTYLGFDNLPELYSHVFNGAGDDSFFLTLPWFRNLERTVVGPNEVVQIIGVEKRDKDNVPVGALILKSARPSKRFLSQVRIDSLTNYYTSYFAPVIAQACESVDDIARVFARELHTSTPPWDVLNIRPVDLSLPATHSFYTALNNEGFQTQVYFCFGNWYLNVGARSYAEYFKDLPSVVRKNVPYYKRRLEKIARVKIKLYTNLEELEIGIRDYQVIYNSSWRDFEAYPHFVRGLIRTAAEEGWLRMGLLYIDEEPAAAQLWIVKGAVASIYKVCYAEKFAKNSVGSVLTAHMLERAIDVERVHEVDYLSGDDSYKANWMSDRRERWGIMAFNPRTLWGNLERLRHVGGRKIKPLLNCAVSTLRQLRGHSAAT